VTAGRKALVLFLICVATAAAFGLYYWLDIRDLDVLGAIGGVAVLAAALVLARDWDG